MCKKRLCTARFVTVNMHFLNLNFKTEKKFKNFEMNFLSLLNLKRYLKAALSKLNDLI